MRLPSKMLRIPALQILFFILYISIICQAGKQQKTSGNSYSKAVRPGPSHGKGRSTAKPASQLTPKPTRPVKTPKPTRPVKTPKPTRPVKTPKPTRPVITPKPTRPVKTPKPTRPVKTPKPTRPVITPKPLTPSTTPKPDECIISTQYLRGDLNEPQPLVVHQEAYGPTFLYPSDQSYNLKLKKDEKIRLSCPGSANVIEGIAVAMGTSEIEATCVRDKEFSFLTDKPNSFNIRSVKCKELPTHASLRTTTPCYGNAKKVRLGFSLRGGFLPTMDICWDDTTMMSHWSMFNLTTKIGFGQAAFPRPQFEPDGFYKNYDIENLYKTSTELAVLTVLLGDKALAETYIQLGSNNLMARGHMTAKSDFFYGNAQSTTFSYINIAPQWQNFNGGNWETLENNVRQFAARRNDDIQVYTGVHGQMTLKGINNADVPIYLFTDHQHNAFRVPKYFWKVIYDPEAKTGTAFVGLNDPWIKKVPKKKICRDISAQIRWLTWSPRDKVKGVSYACTVDDLRKAIPSVPPLHVTGILA